MKKITAFIKPLKLTQVTLALHKIKGLTGITIQDIQGFGRCDKHNDEEKIRDYVLHVKLEIFCENTMVDEITCSIIKEAHTGLRGDGKIYITSVDDAFRISTGETGRIAV